MPTEESTLAPGPKQRWHELANLLETEKPDPSAVRSLLDALNPVDTALTVSRLSESDRTLLVTLLSPEESADLLQHIVPEQAADILESMEPADAGPILDELPADQQVDLLGDIKQADAEAILDEMEPADAEEARRLLQYPDDSAGGIMIAEYLVYPQTHTVSQVLNDLRANHSRYSDYSVQYAYIKNDAGNLTGVLPMRALLLRSPELRVENFMIQKPFHVEAFTPLSKLLDIFEDRSFLGIPVTDDSGKLIGVLRRSAVQEAAEKRARKTFLKVSGIIGGEELRSMPLLQRSMRRLGWLVPNILLNIIAASVIALYQDTLQAVIALAVFLPIVSDMSGCSGNQAVAVSIRELALGLIRPTEALRVFLKEAGVGLINGLILGALLGLVAALWQSNLYLGLVVGGALAANTLLSVLLGGLVPLLLKRFKIDPALASGPILTTATDMCGFFLVLNFANLFLHLLSTG